jgi:RNA polymerase sigma-70 factor (ECF subfamily)
MPGRGVGGSSHQQSLQRLTTELPEEADAETAEREKTLLYRRALELVRTDFTAQTYQAFYRVVIDGRTAGEVAQELGMTPHAVRKAKSRVLAHLRTELRGLDAG